MAKIKRSAFRSFLNVGTLASPSWGLIGEGVTAGSIGYNPKVEEETYIHEDNTTVTVESYAPKFPIESTAIKDDAVFEFVDTLRKDRGILSAAETEVINVWTYKNPISGYYPAEKQFCSVQLDEFGGEGGSSNKINYTVNFIGDPVLGRFNPTTKVWSPLEAPLTHTLTTLTLGSGTLSPLFTANKSNLFYTTSIAAATVTVSSALSGATIVQKCNDVEVLQGAAANLNLGKNTITIAVTVSGVTYIYVIEATRTV